MVHTLRIITDSNNFQGAVDEIKARVHRNRTSIHISFIADEVKTRFMNLSEAEFNGNYGFALKWLLDFREGLLTNPNEHLQMQITEVRDELAKLKDSIIAKSNKEEEKVVGKMADGSRLVKTKTGEVIRRGKQDKND